MNELVSVLVPVYNRIDLIDETLRSALAQDYEPLEVVVVDNASTDGTWERLEAWAAGDARLRVFRNPTNLGPVRNWLACVARAQGVYAKILWSDDLISPDFLSSTIPMLRDPRVGFVYTAANIFEGMPSARDSSAYGSLGTGVHSSARFIEGSLLGGDFPVSPGCAVFRTSDMRKNLREHVPNRLGSDFSMHAIGNDILLMLLTADAYPCFGLVARPLSQFRSHPGSISVGAAGGRLQLYYDVAKAAFVEMTRQEPELVDRFNAALRIDLMRYDGKPYGLRRVADFYSSGDVKPSFRALFNAISGRVRSKIAYLASKRVA